MSWLVDLIGGGALGGLFGIIGSWGNAWLKQRADEKMHENNLEIMREKNKYNLLMITAETDATIAEVEANVKRDQIIMDGKADIEESKGRNNAVLKLSENYVKPSLTTKMLFNKVWYSAIFTIPVALFIILIQAIVDILRTLVRVVVTYGSVAFSMVVTYIALDMFNKLGIAISGEQLYEIVQTMLRLLTFTTSTVIGFWFMDKSMSRKFQNTI